MSSPLPVSPPPTPASPPPAQPAQRQAVATLSRDLADFLLELSITLNKHAIYPPKHPLLDVAIDTVANRLALLFDDKRDTLSIGVARRQLIIEGVATDPLNPVLKDLAQRLHKHHVGALKFMRGIDRRELTEALANLAMDPTRMEKPLGHDTDRLDKLWKHVRFFPLTYDKLQLIEDDGSGEKPSPEQMAKSRGAQLWIGLTRAALVSDASKTEADENVALEPATVARAIDEHQREEAYDQVIVGYLLQIGDELRNAEGPESVALQKRVSRLVGSLKESTLEKLLEMGGDKNQRRKFLLDASQGITVEAVIDLVKAASAAEGQTVSHSMLRMLSKLANHPASGGSVAGKTDPSIRDVMKRLIDDWSLDDPNPEAYRAVLENMSSSKSANGDSKSNGSKPIECEPDRLVQIAVEIGVTGPQVTSAMATLCRAGRAESLLDIVERAPSAEAGAPVWAFLVQQRVFESLLAQQKVDIALAGRFVQRIGLPGVPDFLRSAILHDDAKARSQFYDVIQAMGPETAHTIVSILPEAAPAVQRELLALLGKVGIPDGFSPQPYLQSPEPLTRREAVRMLLRDPARRDMAILTALDDPDDRVVFVGLTAAQEKCPDEGLRVIKHRVDDGDLDAQLRTMGIRVVAQRHDPAILQWLLDFVVIEARWPRRPKLKPSTPEMLAALSALAASWRSHEASKTAISLAEQSKDEAVRGKVQRAKSTTGSKA